MNWRCASSDEIEAPNANEHSYYGPRHVLGPQRLRTRQRDGICQHARLYQSGNLSPWEPAADEGSSARR